MLIDRTHKSWIVGTIIAMIVATGIYLYSTVGNPVRFSGGSWLGLTYGVLGSALIIFANLLGVRKKFPTMRVGRLHAWMKGHAWLGLLSFPLICLHAGFQLGGSLTTVMMVMLTLVFLSGIVGLYMHKVIPRRLLDEVPMETIYEQIEPVSDQLLSEAREIVQAALDRPEKDAFETDAVSPGEAEKPAVSSAHELLTEFFNTEVEPYLTNMRNRSLRLYRPEKSQLLFEQLQSRLPADFHATLEELHEIVVERRQLVRQKQLHHLLHGWLFVHVPLSVALLFLLFIHGILALGYV